ncbi:hypothetical protein TIFTF001_033270 [Ficus carica]|uniref:Uncharacterized protein n=1 Tax=Ficus carica TaxID=3494 RepID=A0AA88DYM3_FICCA|nr:hypothetical protein TIFTF001_033270 [Ficus carica]
MSRCFPFPPPGYERKARNDGEDLLEKDGIYSCGYGAPWGRASGQGQVAAHESGLGRGQGKHPPP